ncbi:MAG: CDP-glycerol glycerophosphotransferase family protein [Candidatus Sabulitectum sp.]|nr:CDP-glycerol glycerophosphotransferase family protein [Candidatus Sabulitectum sp.]
MKLLFYVSKLYSLPVVQPLVKEATGQKASIALFVSTKVRKKLPGSLSKFEVFTELKDAIAFNPDFVLCPGNFVDFRLPGIKVELFHGIGIEKPSHYKIRHFFDLYLTSGPVVTTRFKEMERKYKYFRTFETGWAKIDHILNYDTTDIRKRFNLKQDKTVILYAPTHSSSMESSKDILPAIETIMKPEEIWFCKPHEFMDRDILKNLSRKTGNQFRLITDFDITPYLHLADVMLSDTSSVIYEFMALDKPLVTYRTLSRRDKGINIQSTAELRDALNRSLSRPDEFSPQRHRHLTEVNPRLDRSISKGIIDLLSSIDSTQPMGKGRKPLNLFRKIQILYHSHFRKGYLR